MRLAREIKRKRLDFTWFASACVNQVDREMLQAFREAGCWAILFGVESGVQKNLNTLRKGSPWRRRGTRSAGEGGRTQGADDLRAGIPGETYEEALRTIEFACEIAPTWPASTPSPPSRGPTCTTT